MVCGNIFGDRVVRLQLLLQLGLAVDKGLVHEAAVVVVRLDLVAAVQRQCQRQ